MNRFTLSLPATSPGREPADQRPGRPTRLDALTRDLELSAEQRDGLLAAHLPLCRWIARRRRELGRPIVVGVNGAQGSGKTTFCQMAQVLLEELDGARVCGLSIDDLYLGSAARQELAARVHPLFATRGVPGTHDVPLGLELLARLRDPDAGEVPIPAFDKAVDDRLPEARWSKAQAPADVIILEGWCVGMPDQADEALEAPVNGLEAREDSDGVWRRHVNGALRGPYAELFGQIDVLIFLQVPGWESVRGWRRLQEEKLRRRRPDASALLGDEALERFLMHYERLTRHALAELPERADVVCRLGDDHRITELCSRRPWVDEDSIP